MSFLPPPHAPLFINAFSARYTAIQKLFGFNITMNISTGTWGTASRAIYIPFVLPHAYPVKRVFWVNGSALVGTVDCGLYTALGTRLYSTGPTTPVGINASQYVATDLLLAPGEYYMGIVCSSASGTMFMNTGATTQRVTLVGVRHQVVASGTLPSTLTGIDPNSARWPLFGITRTTTGY